MSISFTNHAIKFTLPNKTILKNWISTVVNNYSARCGSISYQFCDDEYMLEINRSFLQHDTYTDIITFDYVNYDIISGDILISVERVRDNAKMLNVDFEKELCRVIIHGILHLLGFKDKTDQDASLMRTKENEALSCLETVINGSRFTWNTIR